MKDLRYLHYFHEFQVLQSNKGISLSQTKYDCDSLHHFHMEDCKLAPSPFHSRVKISTTCTTTKFDDTLYHQLVVIILYLTHTHLYVYFVVVLISWFMQTPHEIRWKQLQKNTSICLRYNSILGNTIVQGGLLYWLVSLILIGLVTLMIESLLHDMCSLLVQDLLLGLVRNKLPLLFLQQKQRTVQLFVHQESTWICQILLKFGFQQQDLTTQSGVIIKVTFIQLKIQFNINTINTSNFTCTSSESSFRIMFSN